jgi:hypothetical protein
VAEGAMAPKPGTPQADAKADAKATLRDELGGIDAPDFLIKLDKSFARMLEQVMRA